jgi:hypothetical protein
MNLDETLYGDDDIECDLDTNLCKLVASTISKWWTIKLLWWAHVLNRLANLDEIMYGGDDIKYKWDYIIFSSVTSKIF